MYTFIRTKVSGKRKRLIEGNYNLDLTRITPRICAMSFPAANFLQKMYRNDINTVASYLKETHGKNFWIYNLSGIEYDTSPFDGQVNTY